MLSQDISASEIFQAGQRLAGKVVLTPIKTSTWLSSASGADVFLKLENLQVTGSFKYRGALNCFSAAAERGKNRVITASAGNHALGVAEAARLTEVEATICVPRNVSRAKLEKLKRYRVELLLEGEDCHETEQYARAFAALHDQFYVSPYNDRQVIAGQGTVALETLQAIPELDTLIVAVGGGGLISGVALAARVHNPDIRIVGVVAQNSPVMLTCVEAGRILHVEETPTIADGIAGNIESDSITFGVAQNFVNDWVAVPEQMIRRALFEFLDHEGMLIEGAAAATVAAVANRLVQFRPSEKVGVIICGGNVSTDVWHDVCREYLLDTKQNF